jgi:hypothetical protein
MDRSSGFGSTPADWTPISDSLSLRLRLSRLNLAGHRNSQAHYAKGTRSHVSPSLLAQAIVLSRLVDTRFQVLFTPLAGVLFAFPSRYWFTIGRQVVFSLGRWSSRIPTGLLEPRGTQVPPKAFSRFAYAAVTRSGRPFQAVRLRVWDPISAALQPHRSCDPWFGLFRVRSPLLAESLI